MSHPRTTSPRPSRTAAAVSWVAATVTALFLVALSAVPASAHSGLVDSSPQDGATLTVVPDAFTLEFSEPVREPAFVVVTGPTGGSHEAGTPTIDEATVSQTLDLATLTDVQQAGEWTLAYRVVSSDGHPITGHVRFRVTDERSDLPVPLSTLEASQTPSSTPSTERPGDASPAVESEESGSPVPWIVAVVAVVLVAVAAQQARKRREGEKQA